MNIKVQNEVTVVGGGLAGSECAFQLAERGVRVRLYEMRPDRSTPAHNSGDLAELVCSNSLRSDDPLHAAGLLKREMEAFRSLIIRSARNSAVPAGGALAVDRNLFAAAVTSAIESHPNIVLAREECTTLPATTSVIATGPLTSPSISEALAALLGSESLYFYDAIAPIVESDSLDLSCLFWGSRYDKGDGADYLNAPFDREQYREFHQALLEAEVVPLREFEKKLFFEGCLPIEELARRGEDTLRYGPMKPVGLRTATGERPWAVVQARLEDLNRAQLNLVGFQSRMKWPDQKRVLRMIPGYSEARFARLGQVHRNTFINAPIHLDPFYRLREAPHLRLAGQLTGVEGYLESAATGLAAAIYLALEHAGRKAAPLPHTTALGALSRHLNESDPARFQPANINYGLFPNLEKRLPRRVRRAAYVDRARTDLIHWASNHDAKIDPSALPVAQLT